MIGRPRLTAATCALVAAAWLLLAALLVAVALSASDRTGLVDRLASALLCGSLLSVLLGAALSSFVHCPHCGRRLLIRGRGEKSISRRRFRRVDAWASAVVEVLAYQACTCIYCARKVAVPWRGKTR